MLDSLSTAIGAFDQFGFNPGIELEWVSYFSESEGKAYIYDVSLREYVLTSDSLSTTMAAFDQCGFNPGIELSVQLSEFPILAGFDTLYSNIQSLKKKLALSPNIEV